VNQDVASLGPGDYFGEMGMMTGQPRSSSVIAKTDVKCYRLGKEAFQAILHRRPELVEDLSQTLARRRVELDAVRDEASEEALRERLQKTQGVVLRRIREFFALRQWSVYAAGTPNGLKRVGKGSVRVSDASRICCLKNRCYTKSDRRCLQPPN
jgi:hypothetical protein